MTDPTSSGDRGSRSDPRRGPGGVESTEPSGAATSSYPGIAATPQSDGGEPLTGTFPGAADGGAKTQRRPRYSKFLLIAAAATTLVTVILGWITPGFWRMRVLDVEVVEDGVTYVLTDPANGYALTNVTAVVCNNGTNPPAIADAMFTCEVIIDGTERRVEVTTPDTSGVFWVGPPR